MASSSSSPILFEELYHDSSPGNTANRGSRITEAVLQNDLNTTSPTTGSTCTINPHPLADMFLSTPSQLDKRLPTSILPNTTNCEQMVPIVSLGCGVNWPALKPDTVSSTCLILRCTSTHTSIHTAVHTKHTLLYRPSCLIMPGELGAVKYECKNSREVRQVFFMHTCLLDSCSNVCFLISVYVK